MRENESMECPFCRERSVVKRKVLMDGFRVAGTVGVCMLCGKELGKLEDAAKPVGGEVDKRRSDALSALLGGETVNQSNPWCAADETETRFCRDCAHYIKHPFLSRCTRHDSEVNPMDDCPDWQRPEPGK